MMPAILTVLSGKLCEEGSCRMRVPKENFHEKRRVVGSEISQSCLEFGPLFVLPVVVYVEGIVSG
jgi:hypothetical protein